MRQSGMVNAFVAIAMTMALTLAGCGEEREAEGAEVSTAADVAEGQAAEKATTGGPQRRTAFFRAETGPAEMPTVVLSKGHQALCRVKVGDTMPAIELPQIGGAAQRLPELYGKAATVLVFWKGDRRMSQEQLADLGPDVVDLFGESGVAVVGVAVNESDAGAQGAIKKSGAKFSNMLDADGNAFAQVGSDKLPRTYLLDPQGKILWFDIEYSAATRRELHQALRAVTGASGDTAKDAKSAKADK